jgi:hypothetical protein
VCSRMLEAAEVRTSRTAGLARSMRAELDGIMPMLGAEELAVLRWIAVRLLAGQQSYGRLDLAHDGRDFARERAEELADAVVYSAMAELRRVVVRDAKAAG